MAIVLAEESSPARITKQGCDTVTVPAGQRVTVETSPGGAELLDVEVPAGKTWVVTVNVHIVET